MRKIKRFPWRRLQFRSLLVLAGPLIVVAALAPTANADIIAYFNFEDSFDHGPPDFTSDVIGAPDFNPGGGVVLTTITTDYTQGEALSDHPGIPLNRTPNDIDRPRINGSPNLDLVLSDTGNNNGKHFDFNVFTSGVFYQSMTLSFAVLSRPGGFNSMTVQFSIDGGGTWTTFGTAAIATNNTPSIKSFAVQGVPVHAPSLAFRFFFTGGTGTDPTKAYTSLDNIRLEGTLVPEPATVVGGLLGVLGLCWQQRRRLIRSVRFRRT
jgi:hypothetical protein